jgi:hypothetical protein
MSLLEIPMADKNTGARGTGPATDAPVEILGQSPGTPGQFGLGRYGLGHDPLRASADVLSDKEIQDMLYEAFAAQVPTSETVDVAALVEEHIVTLRGRVSGPDVKQKIAELAWSIPGVRDVQDEIGVAEPGGADA